MLLEPIANEVREAARLLKQRKPEHFGKVTRNRYVAHNAWVIAGTRIPTESIWRFHEEGYDTDAILSEYPSLTEDDVLAAIESEAKRREVA